MDQFKAIESVRMSVQRKQAGAELCQAQVKLEVVVEIGVEVEDCHD